jgi:hypothetical protein
VHDSQLRFHIAPSRCRGGDIWRVTKLSIARQWRVYIDIVVSAGIKIGRLVARLNLGRLNFDSMGIIGRRHVGRASQCGCQDQTGKHQLSAGFHDIVPPGIFLHVCRKSKGLMEQKETEATKK